MSLRKLMVGTLLASASTAVFASPITIDWSGTLSVEADDEPAAIASRISNGDPIRGQFTFDTEVPRTPSLDIGYNPGGDGVTHALYRHDATVGQYSVTINNDVTFGSDPANTDIFYQILNDDILGIDDDGMDRFGLWSRDVNTNFSSTDFAPPNFQLFFNDYSSTFLSDLSLAGAATNFNKFSDIRGEISKSSITGDPFFMTFAVDNFSVSRNDDSASAVPEPATLSLLLLGLTGLVVRRKTA